MNIKIESASSEHGISAVDMSDGKLVWVSCGIDLSLIVCGPFGSQNVIDDGFTSALASLTLDDLKNAPTQVRSIDADRSFSMLINGKLELKSYKPLRVLARYTIYGCTYRKGTLTLYDHDGASDAVCDVPATLRAQVVASAPPATATDHGLLSGFFPKPDPVPQRPSYTVELSCDVPVGSMDGVGLAYAFPGSTCPYSYPITRQMLEKGCFVVPAGVSPAGEPVPPVIQARDALGFRVVTL